MSRFNPMQRVLARFLASLMVVVGLFSATAQAGMVSTQAAVSAEQHQLQKQDVLALLDQEQAQATLLQLGVSPDEVEARVNAMSADELHAFNSQVADMQAGGSAVGVVVLVFVILIVLDLLGTTNIFPAIKPISPDR